MGVSAPVRRIGLFGGAFDPPHLAHRALVQAALQQLALDRLHVVPTGQAWHKARTLSPAAERLAMARLAFGDLPGVVVDDREIRRDGPSYTIDTLEELQAEHPRAQLFLVIGADQAAALGSWHRAADIVRIAIISVAARAVRPGAANASVAPSLGARQIPLQLPPLIHSATDIRGRVAAGLGIDHVVVPGVARYIEQHHLYTIA
ncbi:nicotinate (nicotinamide) nucleotide adenylyltransferase [Xylophilus sp.]|uniref:nicotinate (nicotinamide) nucleotide adenylyltransferase n=1 Tax=Xylophilus sp. TaxID=2653893 RepID=UPI0013BE2207|nr:nicotinate (nicotinamide) nucleotide adenylyltransferase [Xylophilus sp.]KAF1049390.1 MAG: putative nicotinate-nucleotide adenylyltransferase [Xylophilus sp.]